MRVKDITAIKEVEADLNHGEAFYDLQQAGLGPYFRDCIISDIESLRLYGGIHSQHGGSYRLISKRFPYAIYYDIMEEVAIILAVLDMRRSPLWIKQALRKRSQS
jgi:hypothetical protein